MLASNHRIEDSHTEAKLAMGGGMLFGIYDGHGGAACGQVVAKRMFKYIAAILLSPEDLDVHIQALGAKQEDHSHYHLTTSLNDDFEIASDLQELYLKSYLGYVMRLKAELEQDPEAYVNKSTKVKLAEAFKVT